VPAQQLFGLVLVYLHAQPIQRMAQPSGRKRFTAGELCTGDGRGTSNFWTEPVGHPRHFVACTEFLRRAGQAKQQATLPRTATEQNPAWFKPLSRVDRSSA
jgi:hypothetical protein